MHSKPTPKGRLFIMCEIPVSDYATNQASEIESVNTSATEQGRVVRLVLRMSGGPDPLWASATRLEKVKLSADRALHIDHLFARMQRLNTYEAKTNARTRIGSSLSHVLPLPFRRE